MRIALTGGIACGKSLVARFLNACGVETLDADDIVHELIPAAERRRLAKVVFGDPAARRELEARIHPIVRARIDAWLTQPPTSTSNLNLRVAIIPLLFEVHWEKEFDIIICVTSEKATQIARMVATRGYTCEEAEARLAAQLPVAEKAAKSHLCVANDGTSEELREKVIALVERLKEEISHGR